MIGDAADDPDFTAGSDLVRYSVNIANAQGPIQMDAELCYQPIGFRWAHNLAPYHASELQRFVEYYDSMPQASAIVLARASANSSTN